MDRLNCIKLNLATSFNPRPDFKIEDFEDNETPHEQDFNDDHDDRERDRDRDYDRSKEKSSKYGEKSYKFQ